MKVEDCMFFQLAKAAQAGTSFWGEKVAHLGVTAVQALVLGCLWEEDPITSQALGQKIKTTSATMTGILDRLEKIGLSERKPHPEDRRAVLIRLTERGRQAAAEISALLEEANREFVMDFSPEERSVLRGHLNRLIRP